MGIDFIEHRNSWLTTGGLNSGLPAGNNFIKQTQPLIQSPLAQRPITYYTNFHKFPGFNINFLHFGFFNQGK